MKVAIMQPYFIPYIGYFQLINAVDVFVIYDNIQYTKRGWINRNRYLMNGRPVYITLPIKKDSDFLNINQRFLIDDFNNEKKKILSRIENSYRNAPNFSVGIELMQGILAYSNRNLFDFIYNSLFQILNYLNIETKIIISSSIEGNVELKSVERVLNICKILNSDHYINPIGGLGLYNKDIFKRHGIKLNFLKNSNIEYRQFSDTFVPSLSIIDVIMFNPIEKIKIMLDEFELV